MGISGKDKWQPLDEKRQGSYEGFRNMVRGS